MSDLEVVVPPALPLEGVAATIEAWCAAAGLELRQRSTLASYPGCVHWHYRRPGQSGTLEITFWPSRRRIWLPLRANRQSPWTAGAAAGLREALEAWLAAS